MEEEKQRWRRRSREGGGEREDKRGGEDVEKRWGEEGCKWGGGDERRGEGDEFFLTISVTNTLLCQHTVSDPKNTHCIQAKYPDFDPQEYRLYPEISKPSILTLTQDIIQTVLRGINPGRLIPGSVPTLTEKMLNSFPNMRKHRPNRPCARVWLYSLEDSEVLASSA